MIMMIIDDDDNDDNNCYDDSKCRTGTISTANN